MLSSLWFTSIFCLYLMLSFKSKKMDVGKNREHDRSEKYFHNFGREPEVTRNLRWCSQRLEWKTKMNLNKGVIFVEWTHLYHVGSERRVVVKTVINFQLFTRRRISYTVCQLLTYQKQLSSIEWVLICNIFKALNDLNMFNFIHFTA